MLCVDEKDMAINGDQNSDKARLLTVQLKRCSGDGCKTEKEIQEYFREKWIVLLVNEARFVTD